LKKKLRFAPGVLQSMGRSSHPFAGPIARRKDGPPEKPTANRPVPRPSMPLIRVSQWTLGGSAVLGLLSWVFGQWYFGWGMFLGGLLALFSLYSLKALTTKVISFNGPRGSLLFRGVYVVRLFLMAVVCYLLLRFSVSCLLGALAGYLWFLAVLAWQGVKSAAPGANRDAK
jgi:hypothetical protein